MTSVFQPSYQLLQHPFLVTSPNITSFKKNDNPNVHGCKTTPCSFPNLFRKHTQEKLTSPLLQTASASGSCAKEKVLLWPSLIHASCDCPHSSHKHSCQAFMSSTTLMYAGNTVSQKSSRFLALAILLPPFLCFS